MSGRTVLVLQKAGDKTLASLLSKEGVPSLDLLQRYGDDLLSAVSSLERHGVAHRDIKPDNIGIRSLTKQRNQLVLFDFSLARAPLDSIRVGTPGYTDPFLVHRKPQRWDLAAERYSAAVTLYVMTLGDGVTLPWCQSKSDPLLHSSRKFARISFLETVKPDLVDINSRLFLARLGRHPLRLQTEFDIGLDRQPRHQCERLEHQRAFEIDAVDLASVVQHLSRSRRDQPVDDAQHGRLAATRRANDCDQFALLHAEADILEHAERAFGMREALRYAVKLE